MSNHSFERMKGLQWDYYQEHKNRYATHIRKCAVDIASCTDSEFRLSQINNLISFLKGCGYTDDTISPLHDSIMHNQSLGNCKNMCACIEQFADSIEVMELPKKQTPSPQISINNSNSQSTNFNISIIEDALSNELSSEQILQLKELLKSKKRGDIKSWLADLGSGTLSGLLSTILTNVIGC